MRGALIIAVVIAMLIVGVLVIKNMQLNPSDSLDDVRKTKVIERAEDAADAATQKIGEIKKQLKRSE